jgi:hypothetical protein
MQDTYRGNKLHTCLAFAIAHVKLLDDHTKPPAKERYNDLFRIKNEYNCLMSVATKEAGETRSDFNKKVIKAEKLWNFLVTTVIKQLYSFLIRKRSLYLSFAGGPFESSKSLTWAIANARQV